MIGIPGLVNYYGYTEPFFNLKVSGDTSDWIGFYGGYFGAVIGGLFAFIIGRIVKLFLLLSLLLLGYYHEKGACPFR